MTPRPRTVPAAVLFDMDGTLLDSEPLWGVALQELAQRYGRTLSGTARTAMIGRPARESMALFYDALALADPDHAADDAFLHRRVTEMFATALPWRPGAAALLAEVRRAGVPTALVTSTARPLVTTVLDSTLGRDTFDTVVCGDEVRAAKPHPEAYLTAAAALQVPPAYCVAVEDSPAGLASAHAAGVAVVGVAGEAPPPELPGLHRVADLTGVRLATLAQLVPVATAAPTPGGSTVDDVVGRTRDGVPRVRPTGEVTR